jgi:hypothetical protein
VRAVAGGVAGVAAAVGDLADHHGGVGALADEDRRRKGDAGATCDQAPEPISRPLYGSPRCTAGCFLDYSMCRVQTCGDGFRDGDEACDGTEFGGLTCADLGFAGGQLVCVDDCARIDWSGCS